MKRVTTSWTDGTYSDPVSMTRHPGHTVIIICTGRLINFYIINILWELDKPSWTYPVNLCWYSCNCGPIVHVLLLMDKTSWTFQNLTRSRINGRYYIIMSKKSWPIWYSKLLYKFGQDFMQTYSRLLRKLDKTSWRYSTPLWWLVDCGPTFYWRRQPKVSVRVILLFFFSRAEKFPSTGENVTGM